MADATAGVGDVAGVTRDYVEVELWHGLAGGWAIVEAEIEGVGHWSELRGQVLLRPVDPDKEAGLFGAGHVLEPGDWPAGNNECVAWGDWEFVLHHGEQFVHCEQASGFDFTEGWEHQRGREARSCGFHDGS